MDSIERLLKIAITKQKIIRFTYDNYSRRAEPYHYGILGDSKQLHAYQVSNGSKSKHIPEWRNFMLEHIHDLTIEDDSFLERNSYHPENAHYSLIMKSIKQNPAA